MTGHEHRARGRKATLIALVLAELGVEPDVAAGLDDGGRRAVAALARVHSPSETTWAAAIGALEALGADRSPSTAARRENPTPPAPVDATRGEIPTAPAGVGGER